MGHLTRTDYNELAGLVDHEFLAVFLEEAADILTAWERACLQLEGQFSQDTCDALFRAAHNLIGSARSVGLEALGAFVHKVEDLITPVRSRQLTLTPVVHEMLPACQGALVDWVARALRLTYTT